MASIIPTVSRKIWFFPAAVDTILRDGDEPLDATICGVNKTRIRVADLTPNHIEVGPRLEIEGVETTRVYTSVNLAVRDFHGLQFTRPGVQIWNGEGEKPQGGYAAWMPYQQGQAKKHEAMDAGGMDEKDVRANLQTLFRQQSDLRDDTKKRLEALDVQVKLLGEHITALCIDLGAKEPSDTAGEAIGTGDVGSQQPEEKQSGSVGGVERVGTDNDDSI